jgi:hypothetical protein
VSDLEAFLTRRSALAEELRRLLHLPDWSNLRGDDVITLIQGLEPDLRVRANDLVLGIRELDDEALSLGLISPLEAAGASSHATAGTGD